MIQLKVVLGLVGVAFEIGKKLHELDPGFKKSREVVASATKAFNEKVVPAAKKATASAGEAVVKAKRAYTKRGAGKSEPTAKANESSKSSTAKAKKTKAAPKTKVKKN
jgi:hypothetical protein